MPRFVWYDDTDITDARLQVCHVIRYQMKDAMGCCCRLLDHGTLLRFRSTLCPHHPATIPSRQEKGVNQERRQGFLPLEGQCHLRRHPQESNLR